MPTPSLLIVPARFKSGKLYSQIPTSGAGDFTVTRATAATRVNASGLIDSVASGIPRLDYFASGGTVGCPALLVEPSGSNLALQSENFLTTWAQANLIITTGYTSPFNNTNGTLIEANSGAGRLRQTIAAITSGTTHTFSLFAQAGNLALASGVSLTIQEGTGTNYASGVVQSFRLDTGTLGASGTLGAGFTLTRASIDNYGNGWYRCNMTVTVSYTPASANISIRPTSAIASNLPATVSGGSAYIWGAQLETGSVATSYIPTTTGSVTRNADVVSVSGAVSGSIGQLSGTIYAEVDIRQASLGTILAVDDGDTTDFISIVKNANLTIRVSIRRAGGSITNIITSTAVSLGVHKIALGYTDGDYALYIDGISVGTSTNSTNYPATALTQFVLSNTNYGVFNDRIRAVALYTTRLTNDQLAALTSP